jgi:hypothetical protein
MKRTTTAKTLAIAAVTTLALGIATTAKAADKGCTNASLRGTYSHIGTGFVTAGPLAGVGTDTFDGNGGFTTTARLSVNGNIVSSTATGTYKVNPDCTGTYTIPGVTTLFFVIDDGGNEIKAICIDPGVTLTHIFRLQFAVGDWRN